MKNLHGITQTTVNKCVYSETSESGPSLARTLPLERTVPLPPIELPIILRKCLVTAVILLMYNMVQLGMYVLWMIDKFISF